MKLGYFPTDTLPPWLASAKAPTILSDSGNASLGPVIAAQRYLDKVVTEGVAAAPVALQETLAAVMAAIESSNSYAEVEERLVSLAPGVVKRAVDIETLIHGAVMLGVGTGAWAAGKEA